MAYRQCERVVVVAIVVVVAGVGLSDSADFGGGDGYGFGFITYLTSGNGVKQAKGVWRAGDSGHYSPLRFLHDGESWGKLGEVPFCQITKVLIT